MLDSCQLSFELLNLPVLLTFWPKFYDFFTFGDEDWLMFGSEPRAWVEDAGGDLFGLYAAIEIDFVVRRGFKLFQDPRFRDWDLLWTGSLFLRMESLWLQLTLRKLFYLYLWMSRRLGSTIVNRLGTLRGRFWSSLVKGRLSINDYDLLLTKGRF